MEGGKLVTKYPIELDGTAQTVSKNRIGGLPSEVWSTQEIVDAYNKWGQVEKAPVVSEVSTGESVLVDSTLESTVPTGASIETIGTPVKSVEEVDPIAAIMG
jgi:hypothetical protein